MTRLLVVGALLCGALLSCNSCSKKTADAGVGPVDGPSAQWLDGKPSPLTGTPRDGGKLVVRAMFEPEGLNYLDETFRDGWTSRMMRNTVFEALIEIDPDDYTLKPQLAEKFESSADHLTHTFHLRHGVKFHDGSDFTAKDVISVFDKMMDGKHPTEGLRADFAGIESWKAIDDFTVELKWKRAEPLALRQVAKLPIYPAKSLDGDWASLPLARTPIGTGPFRFKAWKAGESLTLERFDGWWKGRAHLDEVTFRFVKDHTIATQLFERGEFDLMTNIQPTVWRALEGNDPKNAWAWKGYQRLRSPDNSYSFVAWNEAVPFFADVRVRRALAMAYPTDRISKGVDLGLELPTTCPWFITSDKCDPAVQPLPYDPVKGRALLEEAGFKDTDGDGILERDGQPLRFHFLLPATSVRLGKLVPLLQESFKTMGVDLIPERVEAAVMNARMDKQDFEATSRLWTEFDTEQDQFPVFHSSQMDGGSNYVRYSSKEADQLLEELRVEGDPAKRLGLEHALHRRLYEDQPYLFMTARQTLDAAKTRVHGIIPSLVWYDLRRVWVDP
jgi:peptide/nickel transport system substrate-binding protein